MERPEVPKRIILGMVGKEGKDHQRKDFLSDLHHGLVETSLAKFYPYLNLEEVVVFAAQSWRIREESLAYLVDFIKKNDAYGIFRFVYGSGGGMRRLNSLKEIDEKDKSLYALLNPFTGNLQGRLTQATSGAIEELKAALQRPVQTYVSEARYYRMKQAPERRDTPNVVSLGFLPASFRPRSKDSQEVERVRQRIIEGYANKAAEVLSYYPRGISPQVVVQQRLF
jgi:hypothetical protein